MNVPSDWNSQIPELKFYEGTVWYARHLDIKKKENERLLLYFNAVSYRCKVYLNVNEIGQHEGGFTPFQIDITDKVKENDNFLAVAVNIFPPHTIVLSGLLHQLMVWIQR